MTGPTIPAMLDSATGKKLRAAKAAVETATRRRDDAIRAALSDGASSREIAAEVGLSHTWVRKIGKQRPEEEA